MGRGEAWSSLAKLCSTLAMHAARHLLHTQKPPTFPPSFQPGSKAIHFQHSLLRAKGGLILVLLLNPVWLELCRTARTQILAPRQNEMVPHLQGLAADLSVLPALLGVCRLLHHDVTSFCDLAKACGSTQSCGASLLNACKHAPFAPPHV